MPSAESRGLWNALNFMAMAENHLVCRVCQKQFAKYSCSRCNVRYCSLPCYKSHSVQCTESGSRASVAEELRDTRLSKETQTRILESLKRIYSDEDGRSIFDDVADGNGDNSDRDDEEGTVLSDETLELLATGVEVTLENLSLKEKKGFIRAVATGQISHLIQPWDPWWLHSLAQNISLTKQGVQVVQPADSSKTCTSQRSQMATGNALDAGSMEALAGSVTAAAAKVAAELAPNIVTGGVVAEAGPRPDFSLWTAEDDLLLKNAMEAGAAMEALAKGAMRFSRRFTVKELRERWRALLYDPEISAQAAARMVETELALGNSSALQNSNEPRNRQELVRKRRENSIRTLYYKKRKKVASEPIATTCDTLLLGRKGVDDTAPKSSGCTDDCQFETVVRLNPSDVTAMGSMNTCMMGPLSPKETTAIDFEDRTFSQMFSLLAAGGVGAVIGALPAVIADTSDEIGDGMIQGEENGLGHMLSSIGLFELETGSLGKGEKPMLKIGPNDMRIADGQLAASLNHESEIGNNHAINANPCLIIHNGSAVEEMAEPNLKRDDVSDTNVGLVQLKDYRSFRNTGPENGITLEEKCEMSGCTGTKEVFSGSDRHMLSNSIFENSKIGMSPQSKCQNKMYSKKALATREVLVTGENRLATTGREIKLESPCDTSPVSTVVHREISSIDGTKFSSFPKVEAIESNVLSDRRPWSVISEKGSPKPKEGESMLSVDILSDCGCEGLHCKGQVDGRAADDSFDEAAVDDRSNLDDSPDGFLPTVLTGESSTLDLDECGPIKDSCVDFPLTKVSVGLEPFVCTLNTQDTDIPTLDEAFPSPSSPSLLSSPSDQGDDDAACTDSPNTDEDNDEEDEDEDFVEGFSCFEDVDRLGSQGGTRDPHNSCLPAHDMNKFASSIDRCGGALPLVSKVERIWDHAAGGQEDSKTSCMVGCSSLRAAQEGAPLSSHLIENSCVPHSCTGGKSQNVDPGLTDLHPKLLSGLSPTSKGPSNQVVDEGDFDPMSVKVGSPAMLCGVQINSSSRQQVLEIAEEELESDEDMARFSDVEAMILDMDLDPVGDDEFSARAESRRTYRRHGRAFLRLEQVASAGMQRTLNSRGALAILYGRHLRFFITQTEVFMGRATQDNAVDIDLGKEGRANKVSRQQANIKLKDDGVFYLRNLGRRGLTVNNKAVETGQRAILGSNCLIEVGGMRLIFETNRKLVKEHMQKRQEPPH